MIGKVTPTTLIVGSILTGASFAPAHLRRDFQAISERQGESAELGRQLLAQTKELFCLWRDLRDEKLSWPAFQQVMGPVKAEVTQLLRAGKSCGQPKTETTCRNLLSLEPSLWTFTRVPGVAAENNAAERPLRRAVLWRRKSFGTQSATGSQFVAQILTVITTLRQQGRDVLAYLTTVCASVAGQSLSICPLPRAGAVTEAGEILVQCAIHSADG